MTDPRGPASLAQQWTAKLANLGSHLSQGYEVAFMEELVRTHGIARLARHGATLGAILVGVERRYGPVDSQLLLGFASFWEGCTYCSRGHVLAANLFHFRDTGELLDLQAVDILTLRRHPDEQILEDLRRRFARQPSLWAAVQRQHQLLRDQAGEPQPDDPLLEATLSLASWLAECTIMLVDDDTPPPALHRDVASDKALLDAYRRARG